MTNLSITSECNRKCLYCFAGNMTGEIRIDRQEYLRFLEYLGQSGITQVRLLGGEPTLHPDFIFFVTEAFRQGFHVLVFSNGIMPESAVNYLETLPPDNLLVLVNVTPAHRQNPEEQDRQFDTLKRLNQKAMIGLTIHSPNPDVDFIHAYIETFNLRPAIRLGLAHPNPDGSNQWLRPKYYHQVGHVLADFISRHPDLSVEFDCGFVPCMFPDSFFSQSDFDPEDIGLRCGPIPDILSDSSVVHCFPLYSISKLAPAQLSCARTAREELSRMIEPHRHTGIYSQCSRCDYQAAGQCSGGCIAAAGQRMRSSSERFSLPVSQDIPIAGHSTVTGENPAAMPEDIPAKHFVIPYIDQPPGFWKQVSEEYGRFVKAVYLPFPGGRVRSGRPPQPDKHLRHFLQSGYFDADILINAVSLREPKEDFVKSVFMELRFMTENYPVAGVTIANPDVGRQIRDVFPDIPLTASVLMDIHRPDQIKMLGDTFDFLVPSSRIMRDINALRQIREAFKGKIRLIANEACLPGCPYRVQHFSEMSSDNPYPESLCNDMLAAKPWLRLTGSWVLPQHLFFFDGIYDEIKLAGRVTLQDPDQYMKVLNAYITGTPLAPDEIGGGPASVLKPMTIDPDFYCSTLLCGKHCHQCDVCRTYYETQQRSSGHDTRKDQIKGSRKF